MVTKNNNNPDQFELFESMVNREIPPIDAVLPKDITPVSPAIQAVLKSVARQIENFDDVNQ